MKVSERIKALRKEHRLTQKDLAERLDVAPTAVSAWERGANKPLMDKITIMSKMFNVPLSYFFGTGDKGSLINTTQIPFYGDIAAGALATVDGVTDGNAEYISVPIRVLGKHSSNNNLFAMKVNGESMNKIIPNESYVIAKPIEPANLKDDDIVIYSHDGEYSMKRFRRDEEDRALIFSPESTDRKFRDMEVPYDTVNDLKVYARVIWYSVTIN